MNLYDFKNVWTCADGDRVDAFARFVNDAITICALAIDEGHLVFFIVNKDSSLSVEKFVWPVDKRPTHKVTCLVFSPCGQWLVCVFSNGALEIVPTLLTSVGQGFADSSFNGPSHQYPALFSRKELTSLDLRLRDDCLALPTCALWYDTKQRRPMLIYSNKGGDILFIDLLVRRLSASLQAPQSIHNLEIIEDASSNEVLLLVSGFTGTQWLVPLEQQSLTLRETLSRIVPSELKELNLRGVVSATTVAGSSCLGVVHESHFKLYATTNFFTPVLELTLPENTSSVYYSPVMTFAVHHQTSISYLFNHCCTDDYAPETRNYFTVKLGDLPAVRMLGCFCFRCGEDQFNTCLFIMETSVYAAAPTLSKKQFLLDILMTDVELSAVELYGQALSLNIRTICFEAIPSLLKKNAVNRAIEICHLSKAPLYIIAKQFVESGFSPVILPMMQAWFGKTSVSDRTKVELAKLTFEIFLEKIQVSQSFERFVMLHELKHFLLHNLWYDADCCLKACLTRQLYECALVIVKVHKLYASLVQEIINMDAWNATDDSFLKLISVPGIEDILLNGSGSSCEPYLAKLERLYPLLTHPQRSNFLRMFDPEGEKMKYILSSAKSRNVGTGLLEKIAEFFLSSFISHVYEADAAVSAEETPDNPDRSVSSQILPLTCAGDHSFLIGVDGVYSFGRFPRSASKRSWPPRLINWPATGVELIQASCGAEHTVFLARNGTVYVQGTNVYGQLGTGDTTSRNEGPVTLERFTTNDSVVIRVECGQYHSMAVDAAGAVYGWGWNLHRQIGVDGIDDVRTPKRLNFLAEKGLQMKSVACGYAHTIFLTVDGLLYGSGNNTYGQLSLDNVKKTTKPMKLPVAEKGQPIHAAVKFTTVASGYFVNAAVAGNLVYLWGVTPQALRMKALLHKRKQQLMTGLINGEADRGAAHDDHLNPVCVHVPVVEGEYVNHLSCGLHHCAALTNNGRLFTWGKNFEFQLGHGDKKERQTPTEVTGVQRQLSFVCCGSDHTIVIDANGLLWGWGRNDFGQLGFESELPAGKAVPSTLTIQRQRKGGQRTIQLPADVRAYVVKPSRISGLQSCFPSENDSKRVVERLKHYDEEYLIDCLREFAGFYDCQRLSDVCINHNMASMAAFVTLVSGGLESAFRQSLQSLSPSQPWRIASTLQFYTDLVERALLSPPATSELLRLILTYDQFFKQNDFHLEQFLEEKLSVWAPAIIHLATERIGQMLTVNLRLKAAKYSRRKKQEAIDTESYAEIQQENVIEAFVSNSRHCYRFRCGHLVDEQRVRAEFESVASSDAIQKLPAVADYLRQLRQSPNIPCDVCPQCLRCALQRVLNTSLS